MTQGDAQAAPNATKAHVRRVVTGRDASGKSVILSDGGSPRETIMRHTPGFVSSPLWKVAAPPAAGAAEAETMGTEGNVLSPPGGATFLVMTFPPDAVMADPSWNPELALPEHFASAPDIIAHFEPDAPGMHTTPTLDFATVVEGSVVLELDDGATVTLHAGDTVVQQGTRHAWRNPTDRPATVSFVMLGARV